MEYCHDAFTLTAAVLRAVCSAMTQEQRLVVAEELRVQGERLNELKDESMVRLAATLSSFAALARENPTRRRKCFARFGPGKDGEGSHVSFEPGGHFVSPGHGSQWITHSITQNTIGRQIAMTAANSSPDRTGYPLDGPIQRSMNVRRRFMRAPGWVGRRAQARCLASRWDGDRDA